MKALVIIPAFNESENIEQVLKRLERSNAEVDYLVVNDCSKDDTAQILNKIGARYINLPVNLGIGGAVQAGYIYAKEHDYDIAIQMDGDGQHSPDYLNDIMQPLWDGEADSVIGSRFINKEGFQSSFMRRFGISFLSILIKILCGQRIYDVTSGFRAVNRKVIDMFADEYAQDYPEPEAIITSVLKGIRIKEVPVIMYEREGGTSSIHSFKSVYYMFKVSIAIIVKRLILKKRRDTI